MLYVGGKSVWLGIHESVFTARICIQNGFVLVIESFLLSQ